MSPSQPCSTCWAQLLWAWALPALWQRLPPHPLERSSAFAAPGRFVAVYFLSPFIWSPLVNKELNRAALMLSWRASNVCGFVSVMGMTLEPSEGWHLKSPWLWGVGWRSGLCGICSWNFEKSESSLGKKCFTVYTLLGEKELLLTCIVWWHLLSVGVLWEAGLQGSTGETGINLFNTTVLPLVVCPVCLGCELFWNRTVSPCVFILIPCCFLGKTGLLFTNVITNNCSGFKIAFTDNMTN